LDYFRYSREEPEYEALEELRDRMRASIQDVGKALVLVLVLGLVLEPHDFSSTSTSTGTSTRKEAA
ncbi:MAG: hypothetical protein AAF492_01925, partial [Verrucomicrobiota bacterium]